MYMTFSYLLWKVIFNVKRQFLLLNCTCLPCYQKKLLHLAINVVNRVITLERRNYLPVILSQTERKETILIYI